MNNSKISIEPKFLKKNTLYSLHNAHRQGQTFFAKLFYQTQLVKYNLLQAIEFNNQVLENANDYEYPDSFLIIRKVCPHSGGFMFLTDKYTSRLDQYIQKNAISQNQARQIMGDILKAVYSLFLAGYWTRNLRAEHFVKVGNHWKLESLVYNEQQSEEGFPSEYLFSKMHQAPQVYKSNQFKDQQMEQWAVWDMGCLWIHLLTNSHRLKNNIMLQKFQGKPFSFEKLGIKAAQQFSSQTKQILGMMCHHSVDKRIKLRDLIKTGYISKQVEQKYLSRGHNPQKKIFLSGNSSISHTMAAKHHRLENQIPNTRQLMEIRKSEEIASDLKMSTKNDLRVTTKLQFTQKLEQIMEAVEDEYSFKNPEAENLNIQKKTSKIRNEKMSVIISQYKNYLDKCKLVEIGAQSFKKLLKSVKNSKQTDDVLELTEYALSFLVSMDLYNISDAMNKNQGFFLLDDEIEGQFLGSREHVTMKKLVNHLKQASLEQTQNMRSQLKKSQNQIMEKIGHIRQFVFKASPKKSSFDTIKISYRTIVKKSYDMAVEHYSKNKTAEWACIGMYITFCMAIDKLYIPAKFQDNFKFYFEWAKIEPCLHVELENFQKYLNEAPKHLLVQNSRFIIQKFYQL